MQSGKNKSGKRVGGSEHTKFLIDVYEAAVNKRSLAGEEPLHRFERVFALRDIPSAEQTSLLGDQAQAKPVHWQANFFQSKGIGTQLQTCLGLIVKTELLMKCVRCLEPVLVPICVKRQFAFVKDEKHAEQLDEGLDDIDVLSANPRYDVASLIEDELVLALPNLPQHESCELPAQARQRHQMQQEQEATRRPFEALKTFDWGAAKGTKH